MGFIQSARQCREGEEEGSVHAEGYWVDTRACFSSAALAHL